MADLAEESFFLIALPSKGHYIYLAKDLYCVAHFLID